MKRKKLKIIVLLCFLLGGAMAQKALAVEYDRTVRRKGNTISFFEGTWTPGATPFEEIQGNSFDISLFLKNPGYSNSLKNWVLLQNGQNIEISLSSIQGLEKVEEADNASLVKTVDGFKVVIDKPGTVSIFYSLKQPDSSGQKDYRVFLHVNYFGVLQNRDDDVPEEIIVLPSGSAKKKTGSVWYLPEDEVLSVPAGKFEGIAWKSSLENQNNFVDLHEMTSNPSNMQLKEILLRSKEVHGNDQKIFDLKVRFYDGTSNGGEYSLSSHDVIIKDERVSTVPVTGVSVTPTSLSLEVGETATLVATVSPNNATDKTVRWSSDNPAIATVDNVGNVKAIKAGTATITVTTNDGDKTASCEVTAKVETGEPNAIIETENHTILRFFPNPATNSTTILLPEHIKSQTLIISDTSGKVVRTLPVSHPQTTINVSDIEKGIYLVIIDHLVRKLIVQ